MTRRSRPHTPTPARALTLPRSLTPSRALSLLLCALALLASPLLQPAGARADSTQTSIMQDDQLLVDSSTTTMDDALATMQQLGVQTVRVNLEWSGVAPDPSDRRAPSGFAASDPDSPDYNWSAYDRVANTAPLFGIRVQFNVTGPAPLWATATGAPNAKTATHWYPSARAFLSFVEAAGARYSGKDGVARVGNWSIWNEPNQPGWLAPQWRRVHSREIPESPRLYRALVDAGYSGLRASGHSTRSDTILVGETAPEGSDAGSSLTAMTPIPFLDGVYCVDDHDRPLRGSAAAAQGCPTRGSTAAFVRANPGLFDATGFAHHPYDFFRSPSYSWKDPNFVPLSDISRLENFLDTTFRAYGVHRQIPLYFTEYGYETNPPDPHQVVSPAEQAVYLNEADFLSWQNPRVRSIAQFLLIDSAPNPLYSPRQYDYWDTFQTGLLYLDGRPKPALDAYRMPLWLPNTRLRPGQAATVWGQLRPGDALGRQSVAIQWHAGRGAWRTVAIAHTGAGTGYYVVHVRLPGSGTVRALWTGTVGATFDTQSGTFISRSQNVSVAR